MWYDYESIVCVLHDDNCCIDYFPQSMKIDQLITQSVGFLLDPQLIPPFGIIFSFREINNISIQHISVDRGHVIV